VPDAQSHLRDVGDVVTASQLQATVEAIAEWQLASGMVPWFPGGHADPWNHVEALMALMLGGHRREAELGFEWLQKVQRPDGSWHQYYLVDRVEQDKLDANCIAYVATGVWFHWLLYRDRGALESLWPMVEDAVEFVRGLQTHRGEVHWARRVDGSSWDFALLTGSSSISHSLRCAIAIAEELGHERPAWRRSAARLIHTIRDEPDAFAPKHRWAMDWYYPVLTGALLGEAGRERLTHRREAFCIEDWGIRCVSDRPWITAAETCECAMAHLVIGDEEWAHTLFGWSQRLRSEEDRYWTGIVVPEEVHFPGGEQSTYTSSAVVLAADALVGGSPAAGLFIHHDRLPAVLDPDRPAADRLGDEP
jgi:hypothetical protein